MADVRRVFKYPLQVIGDPQELALPLEAVVLKLDVQNGVPCLWAQVDANSTLQQRRVFQFIGTGHAVPEHSLYVDTVLLYEHQSLVLHLYERRRGGVSGCLGRIVCNG